MSPLLQTTYAKQCRFGQTVEERRQKGRSLLAAVKHVLVSMCPTLAALKEVRATDSNAKHYTSILDKAINLFNGMFDKARLEAFLEAFLPKANAIADAGGSVVFDHVRQTIDVAFGSQEAGSGLTEQAVKDLIKRLPQTSQGAASPYANFITDLLMSRVLIDQVGDVFNAKIAASILTRLKQASVGTAEQGEALLVFFEGEVCPRHVLFWTRSSLP